eukprot:TRINITY_DN12960_c0_g2_i4.p1 TRINITY_DN12960_c0_g2~~TRINITY_DN12960_c0_g2_i4.p1  ORF type:complete len:132 (+),score=37.88 TRINITY_DN12960_c0_g2_i4:131-526(+)
MSSNRGLETATRVDFIRKSLLKDTFSPVRVRKSSDVRIVLSSYEKAGNLKVHKSRSYPEMLCTVKAFKKHLGANSKNKPKVRRVVDPRLSDAGFGGRILTRLFTHSEQSAKDTNKDQMMSALELRSTVQRV